MSTSPSPLRALAAVALALLPALAHAQPAENLLPDPSVEAAETVAARIRDGLRFVPAEKLVPAPDCGMKYLNRDVAFGKLKALAEGAREMGLKF